MQQEESRILSKKQILQKIKRIAYEIYENNFYEKDLIVAGIYEKGYTIADYLVNDLKSISPLNVQLVKVVLDKQAPQQSDISLDVDNEFLSQKNIILVDDVLNTGKTLAYSFKPFLNTKINKLQTAVIIDRNYKNFPVSADYVGYALSTTLKEHVKVELDDKNFGAFLE